jgi:hypothetical protein
MALPTNDDFTNRELSIEELDAIAGGNIFGDIRHGIEWGAGKITSGLKSLAQNPVTVSLGLTLLVLGGIDSARNMRQQ